MECCAGLEWDDFGVPWSSTTCMELNFQVDELDSNLLSIEVRFYFPIYRVDLSI